MDFATNLKFFDPKHRKKVHLLNNIGLPLLLAGAVLLIFSSFGGYGMWYLTTASWGMIIVGGPLWAVSLSLKVKETDMIGLVEDAKRDFKEYCDDKLDYPNDLRQNSIILVGSRACSDAPMGDLHPRRLKSGGLLYPTITLSFLYIRRDRVTVLTRRLSLVEEWVEDKTKEFDLSDLDGAGVQVGETHYKNNPVRTYAFHLMGSGESLYDAPVFTDDYAKEEFAQNILHAKSRRRA